MKTNGESVLVFAKNHKAYYSWVRKMGLRLMNTYYVPVESSKDLDDKDPKTCFVLYLDGWSENKKNEELKKEASKFKVINKDKFEEVLKMLPVNNN